MTLSTSIPPPIEVLPERLSEAEYLATYAEQGYEFADGVLIPISPLSLTSYGIIEYTKDLLKAYFTFRPLGVVLGEPFIMKVDAAHYREPDLMVVLNGNPHMTDTGMMGAADICIEVVSPESIERDCGTKFVEYEKAGVREYWLLDPEWQASYFHRLNDKGIYAPALPDADGHYRTPLLPGFALHVPTLWQKPLPNIVEAVERVRAMLASADEQ
jgi:Uma2 family endonuclease